MDNNKAPEINCDILIAGVGGQGQVLASRLIGAAAIDCGVGARTAETIGMSQRGGCVVSNVRIGGGVLSSAVPDGGADLIIGFELCETARNLGKLKPDGCVVLNSQVIRPVTVSLGIQDYNAAAILESIKGSVGKLLVIDGPALAGKAGSVKACNVVLLGAACGAGYLPLPPDSFRQTVERNVPQRFRELNSRAFELGYEYAKNTVLSAKV